MVTPGDPHKETQKGKRIKFIRFPYESLVTVQRVADRQTCDRKKSYREICDRETCDRVKLVTVQRVSVKRGFFTPWRPRPASRRPLGCLMSISP